MPLTLFAHQAPVLPLKIWRPNWFDGTALCVGAAAPDLAYPFRDSLPYAGHSLGGIVTWGLAVTLLICWLLRHQVGSSTLAQLPDLGPFRVHSIRAIGCRRPPWWQTMLSALLGAASHVLIDGFTHGSRFGAKWLGLDGRAGSVPIKGDISEAQVLQYLGHTIGSVICILIMLHIGRARLFERWYGHDAVESSRTFDIPTAGRYLYWAVLLLGGAFGAAWSGTDWDAAPFKLMVAMTASAIVAALLPPCRPRTT